MAPPELVPFFAASMGAAAALLGLLFVAVSVSPERTVGDAAPVERQAIADSIFTALVNAFFVSMGGAIPGANLGSVAVILSFISLAHTLFQGWRLWPRPFGARLAVRRLFLVVVGVLIYGTQAQDGLQLARSPGGLPAIAGQVNVLFAIYGFAIVRSWELLGARRGLLNTLLNPLIGPLQGDDRARGARPEAEPAPGSADPGDADGG